MMRSLFSGVAGLKTHQTRMDVIGNNIANVNTVAYKSSAMIFSELMSQTTQKASGPNASTGTGGINARQIGLGVKTGAINVNVTGQGASQSTGNPFDLMITGENFFIVNNGQSNYFTRDGSFYVDAAGNLAMTSTGYNVMGWQVDEETMEIKKDTVSALRIMSAANLTYPPEATSKAYVSGIIDKNDTDVTSSNGKTINLNFYDNLGYSYTARLNFRQSTSKDNNVYSVEVASILDANGNEVVDLSNDTTKSKIFTNSDKVTTQAITTTAKFDSSAYKWNGTTLTNASDGSVLFDKAALIETSTTPVSFKADSEELAASPAHSEDVKTVGDALDILAKAYSMTTSDFKKLFVNAEDPASTATPKETKNFTMAELVNNVGTTNTPVLGNEDLVATGRQFYGAVLTFNPDNGKYQSISGGVDDCVTLNLADVLGNNFSDIVVDFSTVNMYDNKGTSTIGATSGDLKGLGTGRRLGDMIGVSIQQNGMIYASYDNGMTRLLGQIASASFANASGLEKMGDNMYSATLNSGEFDGIGVDITANGGKMSSGQLEMSNVDLSSEFTEMITTQRGFQANSRIITVSDTLLEELTNLKR